MYGVAHAWQVANHFLPTGGHSYEATVATGPTGDDRSTREIEQRNCSTGKVRQIREPAHQPTAEAG